MLHQKGRDEINHLNYLHIGFIMKKLLTFASYLSKKSSVDDLKSKLQELEDRQSSKTYTFSDLSAETIQGLKDGFHPTELMGNNEKDDKILSAWIEESNLSNQIYNLKKEIEWEKNRPSFNSLLEERGYPNDNYLREYIQKNPKEIENVRDFMNKLMYKIKDPKDAESIVYWLGKKPELVRKIDDILKDSRFSDSKWDHVKTWIDDIKNNNINTYSDPYYDEDVTIEANSRVRNLLKLAKYLTKKIRR